MQKYRPIKLANQMLYGEGSSIIITGWTLAKAVQKRLTPKDYAAIFRGHFLVTTALLCSNPSPIKTDEKLKLLVHTDKQPNFTTTKQYERKMSEWVKRLKVAQRNMQAELEEKCGAVDWTDKVQAFSKAPKEGQVVGIRKGQRGWQFALLNRNGGTTVYRSNDALDKQLEELHKTKIYKKVPVYFSKGEMSRIWKTDGKELEVYAEACIVVPTNKDECAKYEPIRGQELLLWAKADYEECKHIKIW